jgi:drug/metabolite transporter (DMT)-like permease
MDAAMTTPNRPSRLVIVATYALLCLIWGTTWSAISVGLKGVPPFTGVALRFSIASALLLGICLVRGIRLGTSWREVALWFVNALLAFSGSYGIVYWAEQWVPSGLTAVLFASYPIFVALLSHFVIPSERIGLVEGTGILAAFAGVAVIFSEDLSALGGPQVATAAGVLLLAPLVSAIASVMVKKFGTGVHYLSLTAVPMGLTGGIMGSVAWMMERGRPITWDAGSVGALLYLAVAGSAVTFTLYYWLLSHLPVKRMALIAYIIPIVAVFIGWLRDEPLTPRMMLGSALVIGAVAVATQHHQLSRRG